MSDDNPAKAAPLDQVARVHVTRSGRHPMLDQVRVNGQLLPVIRWSLQRDVDSNPTLTLTLDAGWVDVEDIP